jgi:hypothetical protein
MTVTEPGCYTPAVVYRKSGQSANAQRGTIVALEADLQMDGLDEAQEEDPGGYLGVGGPRRKVTLNYAPSQPLQCHQLGVYPTYGLEIYACETGGEPVTVLSWDDRPPPQGQNNWAQRPSELWVEGKTVSSAPRQEAVTLGYTGWAEANVGSDSDTVVVTVVDVDLDIQNVTEAHEENPGGFIAARGPRREILLNVDPDAVGPATLYVVQPDTQVQLWTQETGGTAVESRTVYVTGAQVPAELWVAGDHASNQARDIEIRLELTAEPVHLSDTVKFTVFNCDLILQGLTEEQEQEPGPGGFVAVGDGRWISLVPGPAEETGTLVLSAPQGGGKIEVWEWDELAGLWVPHGLPDSWPADTQWDLWVYGAAVSGQPRDVTLELKHNVGGQSFTDIAKLTVFSILTQTRSDSPPDRTRKLLGVGEEVTCSTTPSLAAHWDNIGPGALSQPDGASTEFFAARLADHDVTVRATVEGTIASVIFQVRAPTGVLYALNHDAPWGDPGGTISVGSKSLFNLTVQPTTVSFYNLTGRTSELLLALDYWWPDEHHHIQDNSQILPWEEPISYANVTTDEVSCGPDPIGWLNGMADSWWWLQQIHERWEDETGNLHVFASNVVHTHEYRKDTKQSRVGAEPAAEAWAYGSWQGPYDVQPGPP